MYLPNKINKIISKINQSYIINYEKGKLLSISIKDKDIKIYSCIKGYVININGSKIILNDIDSIESLLIKFNVLEGKNNKKNKIQTKDELIEIFSKNKKTFSVEYNKGNIISVIVETPMLYIHETSMGYLLNVNNKEISVDNLEDMKKFLLKMCIIEGKKDRLKKEDNGFEQLRLNI